MIFRCYLCKKVRVWREDSCYRVVARSNNDELFTKKVCEKCGDSINDVYSEGKDLADLAGEDDE